MDDKNHNTGPFSVEEAAHLVERSPQRIRDFCNDEEPIDHIKIGRTFIITKLGVEQARERIRNSKPGPKGPRIKKEPVAA